MDAAARFPCPVYVGLGPQTAPTAATYNAVLGGLVQMNLLGEAGALLQRMATMAAAAPPTAPAPTAASFSVLIKGLGRAGNLTAAEGVYRRAEAAGACDTVALNTYLDACVRCGEPGRAIRALEAAWGAARGEAAAAGAPPPEARVTPDVVSFSTVISALARSDNAYAGRRALALYWLMRTGPPPLARDRRLVDSLLAVFVAQRGNRRTQLQVQDARKVLDDLAAIGWPADQLRRYRDLVRNTLLPGQSEVWKLKRGRPSVDSGAADRIFKEKGWEEIDSSFRWF